MEGGACVTRILALDIGLRRIGLAVSDPLGITAQGLPTLQRTHHGADLEHLASVARQHSVQTLLLGLPLHMSGAEGRQTSYVRQLGAQLERHTHLPVVYWDERLTTVQAERVLRSAELSQQKRRAAVDRLSAVILLQSYLEYQGQLPTSQA